MDTDVSPKNSFSEWETIYILINFSVNDGYSKNKLQIHLGN